MVKREGIAGVLDPGGGDAGPAGGGYGWKAARIGSGREWLMVPERRRQGRLHLFLGAAPCAGKTYALLAEGRRLAASGGDVVVGVAETHGRPDTGALAEGLEVVPPRKVADRGTTFEEMDVPAVLTRRPQVPFPHLSVH